MDIWNFIRCLNFWRIRNAGLIFFSYHKSRKSKKVAMKGLPISVSLEPTTACNLGCPECPSGLKSFNRPVGRMQFQDSKKLIDQLSGHAIYLILYFQGEPFLNPDLFKIIDYAHSKKLYTIISTNGHFLNKEFAEKTVKSGLSRMIVSVDGGDQKTYETYRKNGNLKAVLGGIANLREARKHHNGKGPFVQVQTIAFRSNENQIDKIRKMVLEAGADDFLIKTAQFYHYEKGNPLMPTNPKLRRYKQNDSGEFQLKTPLVNQCWKMWHSCVITWDGKVVPCCFDKDADFVLGDCEERQLNNIWFSKSYNRFRNAILRGREEIEICKNCSEGCKVWI